MRFPTKSSSRQRGATLAEAGLLLALVAAVCVLALTQLGENAGSLEAANETLETPDQSRIDNESGGTITGSPTYEDSGSSGGGSSGSGGSGGSGGGSALGLAGAAIDDADLEDRGFEDGLTNNWDNYTAGQTIGSWTVTEGNVDTHDTQAYANGQDSRFIDLNGFGPGEIEQQVEIVPGVSYLLSVEVSENQCGPAVKGMQIIWNGTVVSDLSVDLPRGERRTYQVSLPQSSSSNATLAFRSTTPSNCGVQIDEPTIQLIVD